MQRDTTEVVRLTGFSAETRNTLVRYYAGLPDAGRIEAHNLQTDLARRNQRKKIAGKESEFFYSMLLAALNKMRNIEKDVTMKRKTGRKPTDAEAQKMLAVRQDRVLAERKQKLSPKKEIVEKYYDLVKRFREEGVCWRDISAYLSKYHRQKISFNYLRLSFEKIKTEREIRGEE